MTCSVYRYLRQNIRTIVTLLPLIALALGISLVVYQGDRIVLASPLFQSPVEPGVEAPPEPPADRPKPEKVLPPAEQRPTPIPIPSPTSPPPAEEAVPVAPVMPDQPSPDQQLAQPPAPDQPPPDQQPIPPPPEPPPPPGQTELGQPEMVIDSGLLIDSILVYISYAWLCCGVIIFVMIPVVFLVLYVLGVRRSGNANE